MRVRIAVVGAFAVAILGMPAIVGTAQDAAVASDFGVSYWPDAYISTMFTRSDVLPRVRIDFYGVTHDEGPLPLIVDGRVVDAIWLFADSGEHQRFFRKVGFGEHVFFVKDTHGNILSAGDPGWIRDYHVDLSVTALTNPFNPHRDGKTSLRVCYDVRPNVPSFGYATEAPGRASYVRTNIYWYDAPKHPPQYEGVTPYRSFGAALMEDGTCAVVARWDGTNDWGVIGDGLGFDGFYTAQTAVRFGPDRRALYQYLKANDKILIDS
jgi:hypothetical protein